jgi:hypothetical protein
MAAKNATRANSLEVTLLLICVALGCLFHIVGGQRLVVLHLFYLPVVLAGFFLGRYRAGVLAVFCVIVASFVMALDLPGFTAPLSPLLIGLTLILWAAVICLHTILVGTLCDERTAKIEELHHAYLGILDVLSRYLNSMQPGENDRTRRVSALCRKVAVRLRLSEAEIDDVWAAALLRGMENIEVTARAIRRAVGTLGIANACARDEHTFHGADLVQSLGSVLAGALSLLTDDADGPNTGAPGPGGARADAAPFGAKIIRAVDRYDALLHDEREPRSPGDAIRLLRGGWQDQYHPAVISALEDVVLESSTKAPSDERQGGEAAGQDRGRTGVAVQPRRAQDAEEAPAPCGEGPAVSVLDL